MASLQRELRRELERTVKEARRIAEVGARKALEGLAVHHHEPWTSLSSDQKLLRNRLRAHGRQLGDVRDEKKETQSISHLTTECAYEHWHRMLFARFLAESNLLIEPETGQAISIDECQELARERGEDWLALSSGFAQKMLPQIFRLGDPVLEVTLAPESRSKLEDLLKQLPKDVFLADDSLGWVYQFWQADRKDEVNASGGKIGADELPAVTQLFTEDYMVDFLLDNTLGAWHAGKLFDANPHIIQNAKSEEELRNLVALPGVSWKYLRFIKNEVDKWVPAANTFQGWPKKAKELKCLDPCMGSGHFVVAMFERLVALRMAEENLDEATAVAAVIHDNLFGLEIDLRCTQIAAFNLALTAWRHVGNCALPAMNLACSGLAPYISEADWLKIAGDNEKLQQGMERLYRLFQKAAVLGSLINPRAGEGDLLVAAFHELQPLLEKALSQETKDDTAHEMAVTARGLAKAAEILASQFTLIATNVPYLAMRKQSSDLRQHLTDYYHSGKACLSAAFVQRATEFSAVSGTIALVTPQHWLFQSSYDTLRKNLLDKISWKLVVMLGPGAFETISGEIVNVALMVSTISEPDSSAKLFGLDCNQVSGIEAKINSMTRGEFIGSRQSDQLKNPDARISFEEHSEVTLLEAFAVAPQGIITGDLDRWQKFLWEMSALEVPWNTFLSTTSESGVYRGREHIIDWRGEGEEMIRPRLGNKAIGRLGVAVSQIGDLPVSLYLGELYDGNVAPIVPKESSHRAALWAFCESDGFQKELRKLDKNMKVTNGVLLKVPFDLEHWQKIVEEKYPHGLPKPFSNDPTQWLFNGHPKGSDQPLHVAVARLLGYQWPRQTGSNFPDCSALGPDGLEVYADTDGIVCLAPIGGESPASDRLISLLSKAFGSDWSAVKLERLIMETGSDGKNLNDWLRDDFFEQHCRLFYQRPFIWHIWDGRRDGFHALVNYHKLSNSKGEGHRTLEKLIYTHLGSWIDQQRRDQKTGVEGSDARLASSEHLKKELEKIMAGTPPYDIFVRWKPLGEQSIGWDPDVNDGVRVNIRPFVVAKPLDARAQKSCILRSMPNIPWDKDRGKEPSRDCDKYPWFWGWDGTTEDFQGGKTFDGIRWNDLHYTNEVKKLAQENHAKTKVRVKK